MKTSKKYESGMCGEEERESLRFKNESNLHPPIPKHMKKSNAKKGSQHSQ